MAFTFTSDISIGVIPSEKSGVAPTPPIGKQGRRTSNPAGKANRWMDGRVDRSIENSHESWIYDWGGIPCNVTVYGFALWIRSGGWRE